MKTWIAAVRMLIVMTFLTGVAYPLAVTGISQLLMQEKSEGSQIRNGSALVGSELIAQNFSKPGYFWSRPSVVDFNPQPSGGSNLGPTSKDLLVKVQERRDTLAETLRLQGGAKIPQDLLFASSSGVDPHLSPEAAYFQVNRVAAARQLAPAQAEKLKQLVSASVEEPQLGFLGQARVNVLKLNLALDREFPEPGS